MEQHLVQWFELNRVTLQKTISNISISQVLRNNLNYREILLSKNTEKFEEFFSKVAKNLKEICKVKFDDKILLSNGENHLLYSTSFFPQTFFFFSVLTIIFSAMSSSLEMESFTNYYHLGHVVVHMLRSNVEIITNNELLLKIPIKFLCSDVCSIVCGIGKLQNMKNVSLKLLEIPLQLITETVKTFPLNPCGSSVMAKTFLALKNETNFSTQLAELQRLSWIQFQFPENFKFMGETSADLVFQQCTDVVDSIIDSELLNEAMRPFESENLCLMLMQSIIKNPQLNPSIIKSVTSMITSPSLHDESFKFIQVQIIKGITLRNNFWQSLIYYHLCKEVITRAGKMNIEKRSIFLKHIVEMKKSVEPALSQLVISSIIRYIIKLTSGVCEQESSMYDAEDDFVQGFKVLTENKTRDSYYEVIISLTLLANSKNYKLSRGCTVIICKLVKLFENCNWEPYTDMIISIFDVIISTKQEQDKMNLMMALHPALVNCGAKRVEVSVKLADLLISYIPFSSSKVHLREILTTELNKILASGDLCLKQAVIAKLCNPVFKEFVSSVDQFNLEISTSEKLNVLNKPIKVNRTESLVTQRLKLILEYSENLQNMNLSYEDLLIVKEVGKNFKRLSQKRKFYE